MTVDHTRPTLRVAFPRERVRRPGRMELRVLDGPDAPRNVTLDAPRVTVGRSRLADIEVRERSISSVHFELCATPTGVRLRDLDSTNGVWFHDRPVPTVELREGDEFRAGTCKFLLTRRTDVEIDVLAIDKFGQLEGSSPAMRELYARIDRVAPSPLAVLLLGETGTGKERAAKTIHAASRPRRPFVVLDCGSLAPSLVEAKLFGVRKGAFTGAERDQEGVFEAANGGTLFIDEIGELAPALQVKLLRTLEDRQITRVGETTPSAEVDVRVIAATHRDLPLALAEGRFREDLYFRLSQAIVEMPPLRERGDDVLALARTFLAEVAQEQGTQGVQLELSDDAKAALRAYKWPGNVRELRNTVRQAAYLRCEDRVSRDDLRLGDQQLQRSGRVQDMIQAGASYAEIHATVDRMLLSHLLEVHGHNLSSIAKAIGKSRDTVRKMLRELQLYPGA